MSTYAIVQNGNIVNVIEASAAFVSQFNLSAVQIDALSPEPGIGWSYDGATFAAPVRVMIAPIGAVHGEAITPVSAVANGGTAPYVFSGEGLPAGISVSSTGVISGTLATAGTYTMTVRAADANGRTGSAVATITAA